MLPDGGTQDLYLGCVRSLISCTFGLDHLNYVKYLRAMFGELLNLHTNHSFIHRQFVLRNFLVQLCSLNPFGRIEAGNVIKTTIKENSKCPGEWKGFSTKASFVIQWIQNATHRTSLKNNLHEFVKLRNEKSLHKGLSKTRIDKQ